MIKFRLSLQRYLDTKIRPLYKKHDGGHNEEHLEEVLEKALILGKYYKIPLDMCMTCAYYHDVGLIGGRDGHELRSAEYLRKDKNLLRWFREDQIEEMAQAIEDHRASLQGEPRSILGKIISDSDRVMDPSRSIQRSFRYNSSKYPDKTREEVLEIVYNYLSKKYGKEGYVKLYLPYKPFVDQQKEFQKILGNRKLFMKIAYDKV